MSCRTPIGIHMLQCHSNEPACGRMLLALIVSKGFGYPAHRSLWCCCPVTFDTTHCYNLLAMSAGTAALQQLKFQCGNVQQCSRTTHHLFQHETACSGGTAATAGSRKLSHKRILAGGNAHACTCVHWRVSNHMVASTTQHTALETTCRINARHAVGTTSLFARSHRKT